MKSSTVRSAERRVRERARGNVQLHDWITIKERAKIKQYLKKLRGEL